MNITISNLIGFFEKAKTFDKVISLVDPGIEIQTLSNHCIIRCDDISSDVVSSPEGITISGYTIPQPHHVEEFLKFSSRFTEDEKIFIHCHAGISRSTAAAILVLCQHGFTPENSITKIESIRPILWPNDRIIRFGDQILGLDGALEKAVIDWKAKTTGVLLNLAHVKISQDDIDEMQSYKDLFD